MEENNEQLIGGMKPNTYAGLMNLAILVPSVGWIVSIVMWVVAKDQSEYVNAKGKDMLNWMISMIIYGIGLGILVVLQSAMFHIVGLGTAGILFGAYGVFAIACPIIAGIKAINEQEWKYPLTIQLIK